MWTRLLTDESWRGASGSCDICTFLIPGLPLRPRRIPKIPRDRTSLGRTAAERGVAPCRAASRLIPPEFFEPLMALGIQAHLHPAPSGPTVTTPYTPKASQHTLWALTELSLPSWKTCTPPTWTRAHPCLWSASVPIGAQKRTFPCGGAWVKGTASPITWWKKNFFFLAINKCLKTVISFSSSGLLIV